MNPTITKVILDNFLTDLGNGLVPKERTPEQVAEDTVNELAKHGLTPFQKVTVKDPITGVSKEITLDRTGYGENKLIIALSNPDLKREQKDHILSMYLWERGKESASMLVDLMRYKGEHTKETRAFKSQMRFDFELFVNQFSKFIREQSRLIGITLGVDIFKEREEYKKWLEVKRSFEKEKIKDTTKIYKSKDYTYIDFVEVKDNIQRIKACLIEMAITSLDEGERLVAQVQNVTKAREREKGKGIYVDRTGRITTYDDPELDDIIKADREREQELNQE